MLKTLVNVHIVAMMLVVKLLSDGSIGTITLYY